MMSLGLEAAWIAVIASLGRVLVAGIINVLADTLRVRREDRRAERHRIAENDSRRLDLCIALATFGDELHSRLWNFVDYQEKIPGDWRTDPYVQRQLEKIESLWKEFNRTDNALRIYGMGGFQEAADKVEGYIAGNFFRAYPPTSERPDGDWSQVASEYLDAVQSAVSPEGLPRRPSPLAD